MANPAINVEILGINIYSDAQFNYLVTGRTLPWLQDTIQDDVWGNWNAAWRDVMILDTSNRLVAVYNLFQHDLGDLDNRNQLRDMFLNAARMVDTDNDQLPDFWELKYFGNLSAAGTDDSDGDGFDNLTEFAFGTNPFDAKSKPKLKYSRTKDFHFQVVVRRWGGGLFSYFPEGSSDLIDWAGGSTRVRTVGQTVNLYDGTGCMQSTYWLAPLTTQKAFNFFRVRLAP